jgi:hypothetical protein
MGLSFLKGFGMKIEISKEKTFDGPAILTRVEHEEHVLRLWFDVVSLDDAVFEYGPVLYNKVRDLFGVSWKKLQGMINKKMSVMQDMWRYE